MSRQLRLDEPGLTHHVTSRGNGRKVIFRDETDCLKFLELLAEAVRRYNLVLLGWVLMVNHYHLVVETPEATLSAAIKWLNGTYASWFNHRKYLGRRRSGHLFGDRFHSFVIDSAEYLLEVLRYVALNPVRSRKIGAQRPEDYRFSSYAATAGFVQAPEWLAVSTVLGRLADDPAEAAKLYREFVCAKIGDDTSIWDNVVHGIFLGSGIWLDQMQQLVESKMRSDDHPVAQRSVGRPAPAEVVEAVASVFDIDADDVRNGHGGAPRMLVAWLCRYEGIARLRSIAAALRLRSSGYISGLIARCERELARDGLLREFIDKALVLLRPPLSEMPGAPVTHYWPAIPPPGVIRETPAYDLA